MANSSQTNHYTQEPLTIAYVRNELRNNRFGGDLFTALRFMLEQYDQVNAVAKRYTQPIEYIFTKANAAPVAEPNRIDVV